MPGAVGVYVVGAVLPGVPPRGLGGRRLRACLALRLVLCLRLGLGRRLGLGLRLGLAGGLRLPPLPLGALCLGLLLRVLRLGVLRPGVRGCADSE